MAAALAPPGARGPSLLGRRTALAIAERALVRDADGFDDIDAFWEAATTAPTLPPAVVVPSGTPTDAATPLSRDGWSPPQVLDTLGQPAPPRRLDLEGQDDRRLISGEEKKPRRRREEEEDDDDGRAEEEDDDDGRAEEEDDDDGRAEEEDDDDGRAESSLRPADDRRESSLGPEKTPAHRSPKKVVDAANRLVDESSQDRATEPPPPDARRNSPTPDESRATPDDDDEPVVRRRSQRRRDTPEQLDASPACEEPPDDEPVGRETRGSSKRPSPAHEKPADEGPVRRKSRDEKLNEEEELPPRRKLRSSSKSPADEIPDVDDEVPVRHKSRGSSKPPSPARDSPGNDEVPARHKSRGSSKPPSPARDSPRNDEVPSRHKSRGSSKPPSPARDSPRNEEPVLLRKKSRGSSKPPSPADEVLDVDDEEPVLLRKKSRGSSKPPSPADEVLDVDDEVPVLLRKRSRGSSKPPSPARDSPPANEEPVLRRKSLGSKTKSPSSARQKPDDEGPDLRKSRSLRQSPAHEVPVVVDEVPVRRESLSPRKSPAREERRKSVRSMKTPAREEPALLSRQKSPVLLSRHKSSPSSSPKKPPSPDDLADDEEEPARRRKLSCKRDRPKERKDTREAKRNRTEDEDDSHLRRSRRQKYAPLKYWKNERLVYELDDATRAPKVIAVHLAAPTPYPKKRVVKSLKPSEFECDEVGETATVWDELSGERREQAIVARAATQNESKLPSTSETRPENVPCPIAAQAFHCDALSLGRAVLPPWISGHLLLAPGAIKDPESIGVCNQVFFVSRCQTKALELAVAPEPFDPTTTHRFLLSPADQFQIPPNNVYGLENRSQTQDAHLFWVIMQPSAYQTLSDQGEEEAASGA